MTTAFSLRIGATRGPRSTRCRLPQHTACLRFGAIICPYIRIGRNPGIVSGLAVLVALAGNVEGPRIAPVASDQRFCHPAYRRAFLIQVHTMHVCFCIGMCRNGTPIHVDTGTAISRHTRNTRSRINGNPINGP